MPPKGFIYLRVVPDISYERTKQRNRTAEKNMTLGYLKQIHQIHEAFLIEKEDLLSDIVAVPVLILDGNADFEHDPALFEKHCSAVEDFLINTQPHVPPRSTAYKSPRIE